MPAYPMSVHRRILLQKSFCGMGLKVSEPQARRLKNDVGITPPCAKLAGDSGSGFEAALIGEYRLFRALAEN
jgi:hypothetical protein